MMVGFDRVHNLGIYAVAAAELRTQLGMGAFLVMVHGLADVVQKAALLGNFDVGADLGSQDSGQLGHFHGVGQLVLSVGGAELEATHHPQDLGMQAGDIGIKGRLFPGFVDDLFNGPGLVLDDLLNVGGMDAAVQDQFGEGAASNLAADRVKAGDGDRVRVYRRRLRPHRQPVRRP